METKYKKYEAYKDSGVEWLGEIPEGWEIFRFRNVFSFSKGLNITKENLQETGIQCVNYGEVHSRYGFEVDPQRHELKCVDIEYVKNSPKSLLKLGDFVFADTSEDIEGSGNFTYLNSSETVFAGYHTVIAKPKDEIRERYLAYLFDSVSFRTQIRRRVKGVKVYSITNGILKDTILWLPPTSVRCKIANFLDNKTTKIDTAIAQKEKMIALLKERKQIMIQNAVTKGLDPNARMKDSGVEWIGEIPEGWEVEPIKYSLKGIIDCEHKTAPFVDEEKYFVVRTSNVKDGKLTFDNAKYTHEKGFIEWTERGIPNPGDILLTREAPAGEACLVPENINICLGQRMVWLKVDKTKLIPQLGIYFIYSTVGRTYIDFLSAGSTVLHFNMADIKNILIIKIPTEEQTQIVTHIETQSTKIDRAIALQQTQIEKLKEYKSTLIDGAVTGKIKITSP